MKEPQVPRIIFKVRSIWHTSGVNVDNVIVEVGNEGAVNEHGDSQANQTINEKAMSQRTVS